MSLVGHAGDCNTTPGQVDFLLPVAPYRGSPGRLPKVDRILVIGWRGQDLHFLDEIRHKVGKSEA